MHYRSYCEFAEKFLVPREEFGFPHEYLGIATEPTKLDYLHINLLYCGGMYEHIWAYTGELGTSYT